MNVRQLASWLWVVMAVLLLPRSAWAFEEPPAEEGKDDPQEEELEQRRKQQDEGAKRLQDAAKKLHGTCKQGHKWRLPQSEALTKALHQALTKALIEVLLEDLPKNATDDQKDQARKRKLNALEALLDLGEVDAARPLAAEVRGGAELIAIHEPPSDGLQRALGTAKELGLLPPGGMLTTLHQDLEKATANRGDIEPLCKAYCTSEAEVQAVVDAAKKAVEKASDAEKAAKQELLNAATAWLNTFKFEKGSPINICELRDDPSLARVAYAVDPVSARQVLTSIDTYVPSKDDKGRLDRRGGPLLAALPGPLGALSTTEGLTELAIRFATGLGKLAIDRAKQEAVLWALGEVGEHLCGNDGKNDPLTNEIHAYWLPQLCRLTTEQNIQSGFGAGQAMLAALVSAVENDAKGLPGAAAGLLVGLAYWLEDGSGTATAEGATACTQPAKSASPECTRLDQVRRSTAAAITGLLEGSDPVDAGRTWSAGIDTTNRIPLKDGAEDHVLAAPLAQLTACGVAVAAELGSDDARRVVLDPREPDDTNGGPVPELHRVTGALASAPACWTLTGKGWDSAALPCQSDKGKCASRLALDRASHGDVERLSTVIRLGKSLEGTQIKAADAWRKLSQVVSRLRGARKRLADAVATAKKTGSPTAALLAATAKLDATELELEELRALVDESKIDEAKDRLSTVLDVAEELLAATDATAVLLLDIASSSKLEVDLFPGLLVAANDEKSRTPPNWLDAATTAEEHLEAKIKAFRTKLADVEALIDALRDILAGDWAAASTKAIAAVQDLLPELPTPSRKPAKQATTTAATTRELAGRKVSDRLGEVIGLFTSILSAEDSDDIAVILEKTASPPGGWRRKQSPGSFTLSLTSHVGVYGAAELRYGQYGVTRERGSLHGQAPTLSVPIGLDFAWGPSKRVRIKPNNSIGFFVPIIDPAAFVQYDVAEGGRLPGPRPITVLSPGLLLRWGIFRTPFTLLLGYMYRPRLRTWEATVNEPGADAHQLGLSLAIDATLWNIMKR